MISATVLVFLHVTIAPLPALSNLTNVMLGEIIALTKFF